MVYAVPSARVYSELRWEHGGNIFSNQATDADSYLMTLRRSPYVAEGLGLQCACAYGGFFEYARQVKMQQTFG